MKFSKEIKPEPTESQKRFRLAVHDDTNVKSKDDYGSDEVSCIKQNKEISPLLGVTKHEIQTEECLIDDIKIEEMDTCSVTHIPNARSPICNKINQKTLPVNESFPEKSHPIRELRIVCERIDCILVGQNTQSEQKNVPKDTFKCYHCLYLTCDKKQLITHIATHIDEVFICRYCQKTLNHKSLLDTHLLKKHADHIEEIERELGKQVFSCTLCHYKTAASKYNLNTHMKVRHEKASDKQYNCRNCDFVTNLRRDLLSHNRKNHDRPRDKTCKLCRKKFQGKQKLAIHLLRFHNTEEARSLLVKYNCKVFSCKICQDYETTVFFHFKKHMFRVHQDENYVMECLKPKLKCSQCEFITAFQCTLNDHVKRKHCTDKPFHCEYCENNSFKVKTTLASHILKEHKSELKDKPGKILGFELFACSFCPYETVYKSSFEKHRFSIH